MTTAKTATLKINGETLTLALGPALEASGAKRHELTVSHPMGGTAVFTLTYFRGDWMAFEVTNEAPMSVHRAILDLAKRMTRIEDWARRPVHEAAPAAAELLERACAEVGPGICSTTPTAAHAEVA